MKMSERIRILEPFTPKRTTFTKDEFIKYLSLHKDDLLTYTTYKLNKMFSIAGYRITKLKGEISLVAEKQNSRENINVSNGVSSSVVKLLDEKINYIIDVLKDNNLIPTEEDS
jgi:6-phosphogluconolactonase (cycloisomerase 2 family)